jgi:hypothetical protein
MSKTLLSILSLLGMLAVGPTPTWAQEPAPSKEELTLRPGDTITWRPSSVHRVRFGGKVRSTLRLTPFADVKQVLDFSPITPPFSVDQDFVRGESAQKVTATVNANAQTSGVPDFFFTCGFSDDHADDMVTVPFTIASPLPTPGQPRNVEIITTNNPKHRWLLKTSAGNRTLTRP